MAMTRISFEPRRFRRQVVGAALATTMALGGLAAPALAEEHEVKPGETLTQIARTYQVSTSDLVEANGLPDANRISIGQTLTIPRTTYTVQSGDTLSEIARDHGVSRAELAKVNNISNPNRIRVGAVLIIPGGATTTPTPALAAEPAPSTDSGSSDAQASTDSSNLVTVATYTVSPGESLSEIARDNGVDAGVLASFNNIDNPDRIRSGDVLNLPGQAPAEAEPEPKPEATPAPTESSSDSSSVPISERPQSSRPAVDRATALAAYPNLPSYILNDPDRRSMIPSFERWAAEEGVPVDLLMAVAWQESGWREHIVSSSGAYGVGQFMPATAGWVASDLLGNPGLRSDVADDNIRMSARYIRWLNNYMGSMELALAGYFQGPNAVKANLADPEVELPDSTDAYVASVLAHRQFFVPAG